MVKNVMNRRLFLRLTDANPALAYEPRHRAAVTYTSTTAGVAPIQSARAEQPLQLEPPTIDAEYEVRQ